MKVSILVTTYNRPELLKRCIGHILNQTFKDFELIIIDDASDRAPDLPLDDRIRYYRNKENIGSQHGDRAHLRRFVHEIAKGAYFIYVCDDDYWLKEDLLERQLAIFEKHPTLSMVIGGQKSNFIMPGEKDQLLFHEGVLPSGYISSMEFIEHFAEHPIESNIIIGATLYRASLFKASGALQNEEGCKWQAGYELFLAPACYGDVYYINEPCVLTEVSPGNASFQRTQLEHYKDSVRSLRDAFLKPLEESRYTPRGEQLKALQMKILEGIGKAYMANAEHIREYGNLTMCSKENIARPVTQEDLCH
jgi:glycosyltransferase involved in cell wall biosynthesis